VSCPVAEPVAVGSNCTVRLSDWPELNVAGNDAPDTEKPVPEIVTELIVTLAVPVELSVSDCAAGTFTVVLPNAMLVEFTDSVAVPAFNCRVRDFELPPVVAVSVIACALLTDATFAVNAADDAVAGTLTVLGTVTAELLLKSATLTPPEGAEPERLIVHASASDPMIEVLAHERPVTVGATVVPVPLRLTVTVGAVLETLSCPVFELAAVGAY
jgi:hypothetical protein